ncbi:MAG: hypothetical protein IJM83_07215 [Firmicutes bacterium]|nr:hypothetical protein [Bacillota bacterium]
MSEQSVPVNSGGPRRKKKKLSRQESLAFTVLLWLLILSMIGFAVGMMIKGNGSQLLSTGISSPDTEEKIYVYPTKEALLIVDSAWIGVPMTNDTVVSHAFRKMIELEESQFYFQDVDDSYFDDALFIGDSRTVGLRDYAPFENADYFASEGIGTYTLEDTEVEIEGLGEIGLWSLLKRREYGKIYIMLGLNEIWAGPEEVAENYKELLDKIREAAPDALIFIQANLYVSASYAEDEPVFSNDNIRALNKNLSKFANGKDIFYIDVNPLFENENGDLDDELTGDGAHVYASLYQEWDEWLKTRGIILKKPELVFEIEEKK